MQWEGRTILVGVAWPHRGTVKLHCTKWRRSQPLSVDSVDDLTAAHLPQGKAKYEWGPVFDAPRTLEDKPFDLYELVPTPQHT